MFKAIEVALPKIFSCALINDDYTGLTDEDITTLDEFIDVRGSEYDMFYCIGQIGCAGFTSQHALYSNLPVSCDCGYFTFQIEKQRSNIMLDVITVIVIIFVIMGVFYYLWMGDKGE